MGIDSIKFLGITNPNSFNNQNIQKASSQFAPSVFAPAQKQGGFTTEELELAQQIADGKYNPSIFGAGKTNETQRVNQKTWDKGFELPMNNGTGELKPVIKGRMDEIVGLDLTA